MEKINVEKINEEKVTPKKVTVKIPVKENMMEEKVTDRKLNGKKASEEKASDKKIETIILDENLMPKSEVAEKTEKISKSGAAEKPEKVSKAVLDKNDDEDKMSYVDWIQDKFQQIAEWFSDKLNWILDLAKEPTDDLEAYKFRIRKEKLIRWLRTGTVVIGVLIIALVVKYAIEHHSYSSYAVVSTSERVDTGVAHFRELDGNILHYSADGASLTSTADNLIWTDSYQMSQPVVETFESVAAIYDLKGTQIVVYDGEGKLGAFQTDYPIIKASVSAKGEVAAILENGETTMINYYTETGSLIASSSTNMRNPGYPVDLSVSKDGLSVVVTYFVTDEGTISSYLAFYNFGDAGRNKEDNLLNGFRFPGILVPEVQYLDNDTVITYSEEGFKLYEGKNDPKEVEEVIFENDIISSFSDGKYIGFIFQNDDPENPFLMKVFNSSGKLKMETAFDIVYDDVKISGDKIILNNTTQMAVYNMKGIEKYYGNIEEGSIHEIVKVGMNKYTVAYNGGVITIKLK